MNGSIKNIDGVTGGIIGQPVSPVKRTVHSTNNVWRNWIKKKKRKVNRQPMASTVSERVALDYTRLRIKKDEGYEEKLYKDSLGNLTGGWGHHFVEGSSLPVYIWDIIFNHDFNAACDTVEKLMYGYGVPPLNHPRKSVLINMAYNLGYDKLRHFQRMFQALSREDYADAAAEMLDSKWAEQVGGRARKLATMMRTGRYLENS